MNRPQLSQVLIAGAGPVGMMAALELTRRNIDVAIVDQDEGATVRSYACLLHPQTVRLLEQAGVGEEVLERGIRVEQIAFAENGARKNDLHLATAAGGSSVVVILPQSDLEEILLEALAGHGVNVEWHHRLTDLRAGPDGVAVTLDLLSESGKGYAVPHMDRVVRKTVQRTVKYLIGADGRDSHVRELLGIRLQPKGAPEYYAAYEFDAERWADDDLCIALNKEGANLLARLPGGIGRGMFKCAPEELDIETHLKDRVRFRIIEPAHDQELLEELKQSILSRSPGFDIEVGELEWHGLMELQKSLVTRYGADRCWLAGDAAHMASPIGMHSMNAGLAEAADLAKALAESAGERETADRLRAFNDKFHSEWEAMFEIPDARKRAIAESLPATGSELAGLLRQADSAAPQAAAARS